jgi:glycosyltransferase involved in cell wall biosynthesis
MVGLGRRSEDNTPRSGAAESTQPPQLSVITPVFPTTSMYLLAAFDSLLRENQLAWRWEIQVDGESVDILPAALLHHPIVRAQANGRWLGPAMTRNRALGRVDAPFVVALDADDLVERGGLAALVEALSANDAAEFSWGEVIDFFPDGQSELDLRGEISPFPAGLIEVGALENYWLRTGNDGMYFTAICWRTRVLFELGGWSALSGMEDTGLALAASHRFRSYHLDEVVIRHRRHPGQTTLTDIYAHDRVVTRRWLWRGCNARRERDGMPPLPLPPDPDAECESTRARVLTRDQ